MHSPLRAVGGLALLACASAAAAPGEGRQCRQTQVAILGAGVAGITAAQALSNASVTDFVIVERNNYVGGRVAHTTFGKNPDTGKPYTVELGANWVQGLGSDGGPENPIWTLAKKHGLDNTYSNYSSILTYDEQGPADYPELFDEIEESYVAAEQEAGRVLTQNRQDTSMRAALSVAGWKPKKNMHKQAVEWWYWDWETSWSPEQSGFLYGIAGYNLTFYQYSDENNLVTDQRGFNAMVVGEANEFLDGLDDPRLLLNTTVRGLSYDTQGAVVEFEDGGCVEAKHVVCTFSLGVLQNDVVEFSPELPRWKREAIEQFQMGTYTKIYLQFNETFWDQNTEFFLYADANFRGYFPVWQSLEAPGFLEGSNIIFVTVVGSQSYRIEQQPDEVTLDEVMGVLRAMFPDKEIPDPVDFMYPRWSTEEWAYGSYSNWPVGMTLEMHQNLRANVDSLWFAGEATSAQYYGFLHGAWWEGRDVGQRIAGLLNEGKGKCNENTTLGCGSMDSYDVLHGTTFLDEYDVHNGWSKSSFETWGLS